MATYIYDGSFEGLLSVIFEIYRSKKSPVGIAAEHCAQLGLLDQAVHVVANEEHAARVLKTLDARTNGKGGELVYHLFLSELPNIEMTIYRLVKIITSANDATLLENFADDTILQAAQIQKMISREVHRMHAFVRFQKNSQGVFYAPVAPDFNVLPLLRDHFERRYADQPWIIEDTSRGYALSYDLTAATFIPSSELDGARGGPAGNEPYQALWGRYFHSVNIQERNNPKLHLRHMPKRYWKYLIEKHPTHHKT